VPSTSTSSLEAIEGLTEVATALAAACAGRVAYYKEDAGKMLLAPSMPVATNHGVMDWDPVNVRGL
jgi:hypothetical protein